LPLASAALGVREAIALSFVLPPHENTKYGVFIPGFGVTDDEGHVG